jgi:hypothetical protein
LQRCNGHCQLVPTISQVAGDLDLLDVAGGLDANLIGIRKGSGKRVFAAHWRMPGNQKDDILDHQRKYFRQIPRGGGPHPGID